ncbi:lysozyme inhibitor LprI family protein, partial [Sulfitobacter sp. HI0027]|uniref:lysozyme inhibitor LprI family protein n=1 Tax=Sulfitobacter sp. HI0027 TaxID=1822226 RepID=UPI003FCE9E9F
MASPSQVPAILPGAATSISLLDGPSTSIAAWPVTTFPELTICSSARLAELDQAIASLYSSAKARLASGDRQTLLITQRSWLSKRDRCQADSMCLEHAMEHRLAVLGNVVSSGKVVTGQAAIDVDG